MQGRLLRVVDALPWYFVPAPTKHQWEWVEEEAGEERWWSPTGGEGSGD